MTPTEMLPILISIVALGISIYALKQTARFRDADRILDAEKLSQDVEALLVEIEKEVRDVALDWSNAYYNKNLFDTAARAEKGHEIGKIDDEYFDLVRKSGCSRSRFVNSHIDEKIVFLRDVLLKAQVVKRRLDRERALLASFISDRPPQT